MRPIARHSDRDAGAVLVWVAVMMAILVGFGALVIDVGALYVEKRQLQNGADAGALAVAQDCANGDCALADGRADEYADLNAKDDAAAVDEVCGSGPGLPGCSDPPPDAADEASGWVRVRTSTETSDGGDEVAFLLAPVMTALTGATVHASAAAAWGAMGSGAAVPFVFSLCEYTYLGGDPDGIVNGVGFPTRIGYIYFHGNNRDDPLTTPCRPSPSGQDLPGGFGRVDSPGCVADLTYGEWSPEYTGNALGKDCPLESWRDQEILIAIYDEARGRGNNGEYHIAGFVGFHVLGYRFVNPGTGTRRYSTASCPLVANSSVSYLCGEFKLVTTDGGSFGGGGNYGAQIIKMVE